MTSMLSHIRARRQKLRSSIDVEHAFDRWEESCVASYLHRNPLAAYVSWRRLFVAAKLANSFQPRPRRVLDFGSSVGELSHILEYSGKYEFIEIDDLCANFFQSQNSRARRITLDTSPPRTYDVILAIDSLEHNKDYGSLVSKLVERLAPEGVLILSGPTENWLYRLGRRIAGFHGHYHHTTIFDIELAAAETLDMIALRIVPLGAPLFRITAWKRLASLETT